ncbi:MAG: hypothetical protein II999_06770 [Bacteroidaceae bacterium]|nr:hypothetical protein [Bacteroidaceae bacterium]
MKRIAIIGSGAFAQQICQYIKYDSIEAYEIVGYFDDYAEIGASINGYPVLGKIENVVHEYSKSLFDCVFIAIGYKHFHFKEELYNILHIQNKIPLGNIISPSAFIHPTSQIGNGVLISSHTIINMNAVVGDNTCITLRSIVNHDCFVDKHSFLSTNVATAGHVHIGKRCFIGVGCIVSDNISICDDVWLSPGCVVAKKIEEFGQYIGYSMKLSKI